MRQKTSPLNEVQQTIVEMSFFKSIQYFLHMLYRISVKQNKMSNGIRVEKGMTVDVVTNSFSNPITTNGGQPVVDAFMRIYGIDIKKAGALNTIYLDCQRIN